MFSSSFNTTKQNRSELSDESLAVQAPSVFAEQAVQGVSDRYTFIPTSKIVTRMRAEGWAPVDAREQAVRLENRIGFQKHMIRFQHRAQIGRGGEYVAEIALVNSHDRSSAYQLHAALYRLVCGNGLMVSDTTFEHISVRHSGGESDEIIAASFKLLATVPQLTEHVESFRARQLNDTEAKAFAEAAIMLRWDAVQNAPVSAEKVLESRRYEDKGNNLWQVYNRVQENLLRGGQKDYSRRRGNGTRHTRTRPVSGLAEDIRLNKSLWHLAEALRSGNLPAVVSVQN
jgi:hypothetical protein